MTVPFLAISIDLLTANTEPYIKRSKGVDCVSLIERKIQQFEMRPATFDGVEQIRRFSVYQHFLAINKFEELTPTSVDIHLYKLLASGKISKQEYLDICIADAHHAKGAAE